MLIMKHPPNPTVIPHPAERFKKLLVADGAVQEAVLGKEVVVVAAAATDEEKMLIDKKIRISIFKCKLNSFFSTFFNCTRYQLNRECVHGFCDL